jgi:Na+-translocating ferredoxin:NAD+ oxidoreductase RnfA subunit
VSTTNCAVPAVVLMMLGPTWDIDDNVVTRLLTNACLSEAMVEFTAVLTSYAEQADPSPRGSLTRSWIAS